ncbi:sensor histidine kinase [Saccharomonospora xinjiangensis]|uniref:sensor histidine kinase n=1 Tax=Saccharomonospora xinjiangensis TaxID=75294 RepID=UPI00350F82F4
MPVRRSPTARVVAAVTTVARDLNPVSQDRSPGAVRWPFVSAGTARWLPWSLAGLLAVVLAAFGAAHGVASMQAAPVAGAVVFGALHAAPLLLCLPYPIAGVWSSLLVLVLTSTPVGGGEETQLWPEASVLTHLCVLGFAGLRVRPRVLVEMWVLTLAAGVILVGRMPPGDHVPDVEELGMLSAVVLVAAGAVRGRAEASLGLEAQRALTAAEQQRRAVLEERSRIARELHDVLAHHMSVIAIQAEAAPYRVADPPERLTESFATIRTHAHDALTELRRVLGVLRSGGDDADSAPQPTLSRVADLVAGVRDAGLRVTTVVSGDPVTLPSGLELSAYRIVQEGLNNVLRHAPGADVGIEIEYRPSRLRLRVANGPAATRPSRNAASGNGHGIVGMRERVGMLNGELTVGATPDGGYAIEAVLPLSGGDR